MALEVTTIVALPAPPDVAAEVLRAEKLNNVTKQRNIDNIFEKVALLVIVHHSYHFICGCTL